MQNSLRCRIDDKTKLDLVLRLIKKLRRHVQTEVLLQQDWMAFSQNRDSLNTFHDSTALSMVLRLHNGFMDVFHNDLPPELYNENSFTLANDHLMLIVKTLFSKSVRSFSLDLRPRETDLEMKVSLATDTNQAEISDRAIYLAREPSLYKQQLSELNEQLTHNQRNQSLKLLFVIETGMLLDIKQFKHSHVLLYKQDNWTFFRSSDFANETVVKINDLCFTKNYISIFFSQLNSTANRDYNALLIEHGKFKKFMAVSMAMDK